MRELEACTVGEKYAELPIDNFHIITLKSNDVDRLYDEFPRDGHLERLTDRYCIFTAKRVLNRKKKNENNSEIVRFSGNVIVVRSTRIS